MQAAGRAWAQARENIQACGHFEVIGRSIDDEE